VKKVISGVLQAAEEKKISAVLAHISKICRDLQGNFYKVSDENVIVRTGNK